MKREIRYWIVAFLMKRNWIKLLRLFGVSGSLNIPDNPHPTAERTGVEYFLVNTKGRGYDKVYRRNTNTGKIEDITNYR